MLFYRHSLCKMAINFFSGKKSFRSLSNFWENDVVIDGRVYQSGEHAFHGEKFIRLANDNPKLIEYGNTFLKPSYETPALAKKMGGKKGLRLNDEQLQIWSEISIDIQKQISKYKFDNYEEVRRDLLLSKGNLLIHPALRCRNVEACFWEGKAVLVDGNTVVLGQNILGKIWMELRDTL